MVTALIAASLVASAPLDTAKQRLAEHKLDDVLFALDGQQLAAGEENEAASVLGRAAKEALVAHDEVMALQLSQNALKKDGRQLDALEAGARVHFSQQEFGAAERLADQWVSVAPKSQPARLLRAELAAEAGEWERVVQQISAVKFDGELASKAAALKSQAQSERGAKAKSLSTVAAVEKASEHAAEQAKRRTPPQQQGMTVSADVVLYSASWCGYCKKARAWLQEHNVSFVERDIESDPGAAEAMVARCSATGQKSNGVPVIDAHGTVIVGWSETALARALKK